MKNQKHAILLKTVLLSSLVLFGGGMKVSAIDKTSDATFEIEENTTGTLLLDVADLQFGKHAVSPNDITGKATNNTNTKITEFSGSKPGWKLQVKMSKFEDATKSKTAKDVQLFFPQVNPIATDPSGQTDAPTILGVSNSFVDTLKGTIVKDDNVNVTLATAAVGKGYGEWTLPYDVTGGKGERAQIKIPTGSQVASYTSKLTYTLTEGP